MMNKGILIGIAMFLLVLVPAFACIENQDCPVVIKDVIIKPCIDNARENASMSMWVNVTACGLVSSYDNWILNSNCGDDASCRILYMKNWCDNVSIQAIIYYGDSNEQATGWTDYEVPLYPTFYFDSSYFSLNKTGDYTIKIYARSMNSSELMATQLLDMSVNSDGKYEWECEYNSANESIADVRVPNNLYQIFNGFGNSWTSNIMYLLFMIGMGGFIFYAVGKTRGGDEEFMIASILVVELFLMILGVWIKALSPMLLVIAGIGLSLWLGPKIANAIRGGK